MRRLLLPAAVLLLLAFPAAAAAKFYAGSFQPQVNNDGVEISVKTVRGVPRRVTQFEYHNVPTGTPCNGSYIFFRSMKVNDAHRFQGRGHPGKAGNAAWPPYPQITVAIRGRFVRQGNKIVGTLRLIGKGGCAGDTGALKFVAPHVVVHHS
jgi:hypothetical protein